MDRKGKHGVQLLLRVVVRDPDGKVLSDTGQKQSKSFVIQFLEWLYYMFATQPVTGNATDTAGAETEIYSNLAKGSRQTTINVGAGGSTYGIVVGSGITAESNTDFKLATQIAHGIGAGQIQYGAMDVTDTPKVVSGNVDWVVKRPFTNGSGATVTVREAGIYMRDQGLYHCIIRDVLPAAVDVPNLCSLTVYYTYRTTV